MRWRWMENIGQVETPFQWLVPQWRRRTSDHWFYWTLAMVFLTCPCYCCSYPLLVVMQEHHCVCDPGTSSSSILNILFVLQWTIINNAFVCLFVCFLSQQRRRGNFHSEGRTRTLSEGSLFFVQYVLSLFVLVWIIYSLLWILSSEILVTNSHYYYYFLYSWG